MTPQEQSFLDATVPAAQACQQSCGVPASVTLAQAILESGWGNTGLAREANNYFGIKAGAHATPDQYMEFPTAEYENGKRVMVEAEFAKYPSVAASFIAHGLLLSSAQRYAPAMAVKDDPLAFAQQLQACGYSTSPTYASTLAELMREFNLMQYDLAAGMVS